jgi:hypothetical protein
MRKFNEMVQAFMMGRGPMSILRGLAIALVLGCGGGPDISSVRGTVTLDGDPLSNATVVFTPEEGGRSSLGRTNLDGEYTLLYSAGNDGALVGRMRVRITCAEEYTDSNDRTRMKPEIVPARYNEKSELVADVKRAANVINFDLKSEE